MSISFKITNDMNKFLKIFDIAQYYALKKAGEYIVNKANDLTPVDTGELRSNNKYKVTRISKELTIYNSKHYAVFVEYGTRKMEAQPFLRPAILNNIQEINTIVGRSMKSDID